MFGMWFEGIVGEGEEAVNVVVFELLAAVGLVGVRRPIGAEGGFPPATFL